MILVDLTILFFGLVGHAALWIGLINRLHGTGIPRAVVKAATLALLVGLAAVPLGFLALVYIHDLPWLRPTGWQRLPLPARVYGAVSLLAGAAMALRLAWRSRPLRDPLLCRTGASQRHRIGDYLDAHPVANPFRRALARVPGNQCLELEVVEKSIEIPRLPAALDGLVIAHLTDLHFTGGISRSFFQEIVRLANEMRPDLIAVTGDLVDKAHCIDWIPDTLGRLEAPHGVFAILGNHDLRVKGELGRLRQTLGDAGMVDLGKTWRHVAIGGTRVLLAGNELPWIRPTAGAVDFPSRQVDAAAPRLLLSHTPDQFAWARRHEFDLVLAGHTHGGQIRLPAIGAIVCPSRHGVKYAAGTFYEPPTVMHVSRGLSGLDAVRFCCRPELVRLVLRSPSAQRSATADVSAAAKLKSEAAHPRMTQMAAD